MSSPEVHPALLESSESYENDPLGIEKSSMSFTDRPSGSVGEGALIECALRNEDEEEEEVSVSDWLPSEEEEDVPEGGGGDADVLTLGSLRRLGVDLNAVRNLFSASSITVRLLSASSTPSGGTYLQRSMTALYNSGSSLCPFNIVSNACMMQV